jgi:hypothetical protein
MYIMDLYACFCMMEENTLLTHYVGVSRAVWYDTVLHFNCNHPKDVSNILEIFSTKSLGSNHLCQFGFDELSTFLKKFQDFSYMNQRRDLAE